MHTHKHTNSLATLQHKSRRNQGFPYVNISYKNKLLRKEGDNNSYSHLHVDYQIISLFMTSRAKEPECNFLVTI